MGTTEATVRRLALSLPETTEEPHHDMTSFRVGGKIFATVTPRGRPGARLPRQRRSVVGLLH
jgi:hypothetical protein